MVCTFVFWDVKHGSAAYIETPTGKKIAIDLGVGSYGGSNDEFSPLLYLKNEYKVTLDAVIITHPHSDHLYDIKNFNALSPRVLSRPRHLTEQEIRDGNRSDDKDIIDKYWAIHTHYNDPVLDAVNPMLSVNNGGVDIKQFVPSSCATSNLNNHSVVTVVSYANSKIIIPGDNEPASWTELLGRTDFVSAIKDTDILVAPHHGRDSGFSASLFEHINPRLTIISDGRFCDTSATDRYGQKTRGWTVHKRSGGTEERKVVTTRSDGSILIKFGKNQDGKSFIEARIN